MKGINKQECKQNRLKTRDVEQNDKEELKGKEKDEES